MRESTNPMHRTPSLTPLFTGRFLRSVTQGYLAIVVPLYLLALGYSAASIGVLIAVGSGSSAVLTLAVGVLADRIGRKPILVLFGGLTAAAGVVFALHANFIVLMIAGALGTIGQGGGAGSGGAFGPYFVAEQELTAEIAGDERRTSVFARLSMVGAIGGVVGAGIAALPDLLRTRGFVGAEAFIPLFWLTGAIGVALALVILPIRERSAAHLRTAPRAALSPLSWSIIRRFMLVNATNGLAIGFLGPILILWFHERYGVGAGPLAALYFAVNLLSILSYLGVTRIVRVFGGAVRTVVGMRILSCVLLALIPLAPTFAIAAITYTVRMLFNIVTLPVRQSYAMGVIAPMERSRASALSNFPARITSMAGPVTTGALIEYAWIGLPLELASALQLLNAALYWIYFRNTRPPEEIPDAIMEA